MRAARVAALLGAFAAFYAGWETLGKNDGKRALVALVILAPVAIGGFVAFGVIPKNAKLE